MAPRPSLAGRAVLAVILMIGFYVLALVIMAVLLAIPILMFLYLERVIFQVVIACLIGSGVVFWSVLPRPDRFVPPGPRLTPQEHPRLFAEIEETARSTDQEIPAEVYLDPTLNAWVAQRGGFMGFGSRRVMAIGLPMLAVLNVTQLRAVLAHEFGHYHGGDTKLGPWVYKTRQAIIRTVSNMARSRRLTQHLLRHPFIWYGNLFLRITHAISRRQELAADALAVRVAGARAQAEALRIIHRAGVGFTSFISDEVDPVLKAGFKPPIALGFQEFLAATPITAFVDGEVQKELERTERNPYDTHPPLKERLAALGNTASGNSASGENLSALSLLERVHDMETALLSGMVKKSLKPIEWPDVPRHVYIPSWEGMAKEFGDQLRGIKAAELPALAADFDSFSMRFAKSAGGGARAATNLALGVPGVMLALALHKRGWTLVTSLGTPIVFRRDRLAIEPFNVLPRLIRGEMMAEAWRKTCADA